MQETICTLTTLTTSRPAWVQEIEGSYYQDPTASTVISELLVKSSNNHDFTFQESNLRRNGLIYVVKHGSLRERLVEEAHASVMGDKKRIEREFTIGEWVYLRLQPYRKAIVVLHRNLKLAPRYFGPYQVIARIGKVAYRLQLLPRSQVHLVFHVSQLKKKVGDLVVPSSDLPKTGPDGQIYEPLFSQLSSSTERCEILVTPKSVEEAEIGNLRKSSGLLSGKLGMGKVELNTLAWWVTGWVSVCNLERLFLLGHGLGLLATMYAAVSRIIVWEG
ncbi:hypothetical protein EZV62_025145 [Acer yangbiense]|uniref:Tf2-1-like SH3-like domain-containing protein n=1 Tax=Acer yangbiense TaxID=1000413 RepID=A0A5C7GX31_9ROSI|nr:hypothetical protein EZV62_025145 [Acer yangbiense]